MFLKNLMRKVLLKTWAGLAYGFSEEMPGKGLELRGLPDALHHEGSDADCTGIDGVRVVVATLRIAFALAGSQLHEIWLRSLVTERLQPVAGVGIYIQKRNVLFLGDGFHGRHIVAVAVLIENSVLEPAAAHRGKEHGSGALGPDLIDETTEIVAVGPVCGGVAEGVVLLGVIVPELKEHIVTGLKHGHHPVPMSESTEALGTPTVTGVIHDLDPIVEEARKDHAPTSFGAAFGHILWGASAVTAEVYGRIVSRSVAGGRKRRAGSRKQEAEKYETFDIHKKENMLSSRE